MIIKCGQCGTSNRVDPATADQRQPVCGKCGFLLQLPTSGVDDQGKPVVVTDASFAAEVLATSNRAPVLVDCWAVWCGPCRMIAPVLDQLAAESNGRYRIAKLNTDENPATSAAMQIRSIPTLIIFKNGKEVDRIVGVQQKHTIALTLGRFM